MIFLGRLATAMSSSSVTLIKKEEADEEDITNTNVVPPSAMKFSTPAASTNDADDTFEGVLDDSNDGYTPDWTQGNNSSNEDEADSP
jgi:hypothetical protein